MPIKNKLSSANIKIIVIGTLVTGIMIVTVIPGIYVSLKGNLISIRYMDYFLSGESNHIPEPINEHLISQILYGLALLNKGDTDDAIFQLDNPRIKNNFLGASVYAKARFNQGDYDEAINLWSSIGDAKSIVETAKMLRMAGDYESALFAYERLYTTNPSLGLLYLVDFLIYDQNDFQKAEGLLRDGLQYLPNSTDRRQYFHRLAHILRTENRLDEAEQVVQTGLLEYPLDVNLHISQGWIYFDQGRDFDLVQEKFLYAAYIDDKRGDGYFALAQAIAQNGDFAKADGWFENALKLNPDKKNWYLLWADQARESGNNNKAIEIYKSFIAKYPSEANGYYQLAITYAAIGNPMATEYIKQAVEISKPPNENYYIQAARIYEQFDLREDAIRYYLEALNLNPNNATAQKNVNRLQTP